MSSEALYSIFSTAVHGAQAAGSVALQYAQIHPIKAGGVLISTALTLVLGPGWVIVILLKAIGFGSLGISAGSAAAWWQATVYGANVPAEGNFACFTAMGMTRTRRGRRF